jgi:uncharacterized protein (TIGR03067 family)
MSQSLEGTWQPLYAELDGQEAPHEVVLQTEVELAAGRYTVRFGGIAADQGTYEIDTAGLTLRGTAGPNAGHVIPCIFKFVDDTLIICYGLNGARPARFGTTAGSESAAPQRYLVTYARKPA